MKKNRRKKDKSAEFQIGVVNFHQHLKSSPGAARDAAMKLLQDADVIIAEAPEGNRAPFYGTECLEEFTEGKIDESIQKKMVIVHFEVGKFAQQAEELRKLVEELKGTCCYTAAEGPGVAGGDDAKELPTIMFTRDGYVQFHEQGQQRGMIMARTRETAKLYVDLMKRQGIKVSIADIEAAPGSTLERQLAESMKEGANCAFVVRSIEGETINCDVLVPSESHRR